MATPDSNDNGKFEISQVKIYVVPDINCSCSMQTSTLCRHLRRGSTLTSTRAETDIHMQYRSSFDLRNIFVLSNGSCSG